MKHSVTIMGNCAKCGKELSFLERDKTGGSDMASFFDALKSGRFPEYSGKEVCTSCMRELLKGHANQLTQGEINSKTPPKGMKESEYTYCLNSLGLLRGETIKLQYVCYRQTISPPSMWNGQQSMESHKGLLVFTNDNMIFMQQEGRGSTYAQALRFPIESICGLVSGGTLIKHIRFTVGVIGASQQHEFINFISTYGQKEIFEVRVEIDKFLKEARENKKIQKEKTNVQVVVDFSSLKDVMARGGIVMTAYKCPNCNGMVDLPEAGKVLICKYCGTPIKPVDIFEKIKLLMQSGETVTQNPKEVESELEKQKDESKPDWYKEALKQHYQ